MIYLINDKFEILEKFQSILQFSKQKNIPKSTVYDRFKKNDDAPVQIKDMLVITKEAYDTITGSGDEEQIKIGANGFVGDEGNYNFDQGNYYWNSRGKMFYISQELADKLFFEFSKHGLDLTQAEVRLRNNIGLREWHSMKSRLNLYKDSDIFSPETRKNYTDEEYRAEARRKIHELNAFKKRAVIDEYNKYHIKRAKKWRDEANKKEFSREFFLAELDEWMAELPKKEVIVRKNESKNLSGPLVVATADWHVGGFSKSEYINPEYNISVIKKLMDKLIDSVNKENSSEVTLVMAGDFIESWAGLNHADTWKSIEAGKFGAEVVKSVVDIVMDKLISNIHNLKRIVGVGGNHDRGTNDAKKDAMAEVASVIFYILEKIYPEIEFIYDPFCVVKDFGNIRYIIQHGYHRAPYKGKPSGESLINDYGSQDKFNLVLTGDKHTRGIIIDAWNRRHVKIPPMFTGNRYSAREGFSSMSGCLFIREDNGLPRITDISFYSKLNENK